MRCHLFPSIDTLHEAHNFRAHILRFIKISQTCFVTYCYQTQLMAPLQIHCCVNKARICLNKRSKQVDCIELDQAMNDLIEIFHGNQTNEKQIRLN